MVYRTEIVIWSEYDPTQNDLHELAWEAENGDAYCTKQDVEFIDPPQDHPEWGDGLQEFFYGGDYEEDPE